MTRQPHRAPARGILAALVVAAASATLAACGGGSTDGLPSRQEFVDNLDEQSDGFITEDIASCMYDELQDDPAAAQAVKDTEGTDEVPEELMEIALECLGAEPSGEGG